MDDPYAAVRHLLDDGVSGGIEPRHVAEIDLQAGTAVDQRGGARVLQSPHISPREPPREPTAHAYP